MDQSLENHESTDAGYTSVHYNRKLLSKKTVEQFSSYEKMLDSAASLSDEHSPLVDCVEVEDIDLSDDESQQDFDNLKKSQSLNVDSNCRITSRRPSAGNFSKADSCVTEFREGGVNFSSVSGKRDSGSYTDSEDIELSDEEKVPPNFLSIKCIDLNSFITVSSKLPSQEKMKSIKTGSKTSESSSTDVEIVYSDDDSVVPSNDGGGNTEKNKQGKKPVATVLKRVSHNVYMPVNEELPEPAFYQSDDVLEELDDEVFLLNSDSLDPVGQRVFERPFLRRRHLCSDTSGCKDTSHTVSRQSAFRKFNPSYVKGEALENSTDSETLSDDENPCAQTKKPKGRYGRCRGSLVAVSNDSNDLTDEEELFVEGFNDNQKNLDGIQEWTETDETGGVRQVTQITTETSIKLSGEEEEKMGEDVSHTTTTTTRIVTTVTTQDGEEQQQLSTEGGDELRHSMEVILNQFMSEGSPSTQSEQPPQ